MHDRNTRYIKCVNILNGYACGEFFKSLLGGGALILNSDLFLEKVNFERCVDVFFFIKKNAKLRYF